MNTARQIKRLGEDLNIKNTMIVGNKVNSEEDRRLIEEQLSDFPVLGHMSFNPGFFKRTEKGNPLMTWMKKLKRRSMPSSQSWRRKSNSRNDGILE